MISVSAREQGGSCHTLVLVVRSLIAVGLIAAQAIIIAEVGCRERGCLYSNAAQSHENDGGNREESDQRQLWGIHGLLFFGLRKTQSFRVGSQKEQGNREEVSFNGWEMHWF
ncbi:hypothetical protein EDD21DRAFT_361303 [Dissophora ornata]|nr:hypothetical protein EDD21DRAFT_361303 [Dissophora ornata]